MIANNNGQVFSFLSQIAIGDSCIDYNKHLLSNDTQNICPASFVTSFSVINKDMKELDNKHKIVDIIATIFVMLVLLGMRVYHDS